MMERVGSTMEPSLTATEGLYLNRNVGYADSDAALQAVSDTIMELGVHVQRLKENITRLVVDPEGGKCVGVGVGDTTVRGKTTIVSTGAWTPSLLEKSKIFTPPGLLQVTAVGVAVIDLSDSEFDSLKSMPILVTENGNAIQPDLTTANFVQGEVMLSKLHKVLKVTTTETFRVDDPDKLSDEVDITPNREVLEKMLPQFKGRKPKRFCCP